MWGAISYGLERTLSFLDVTIDGEVDRELLIKKLKEYNKLLSGEWIFQHE